MPHSCRQKLRRHRLGRPQLPGRQRLPDRDQYRTALCRLLHRLQRRHRRASITLGTVPRTGDQTIYFPKIDWQVNGKNHVSVEANRMRWTSPAGIQTSPAVAYGLSSFGNDYVRDNWIVGKLDTLFTPAWSNEARYMYGRDFEYETNQAPTPYETSTLINTPTYTNPLGLPTNVYLTGFFQIGTPQFLSVPLIPTSAVGSSLTPSTGSTETTTSSSAEITSTPTICFPICTTSSAATPTAATPPWVTTSPTRTSRAMQALPPRPRITPTSTRVQVCAGLPFHHRGLLSLCAG